MEDSTLNPGNDTSNPGNASPGAVQRGVDSAGTALHSTIDKVVEPARNTMDRVSTAAHQTVDKLASEATHAADRFSEQAQRVAEAPRHAVDCSKSWIQDKPLEAVGAALALGFILGRLTAR